MEKTCVFCRTTKPIDDFYKFYRYNKIDRQNKCKSCQSLINYRKINCICGKDYTYSHRKRHLKSNYHILSESGKKSV